MFVYVIVQQYLVYRTEPARETLEEVKCSQKTAVFSVYYAAILIPLSNLT